MAKQKQSKLSKKCNVFCSVLKVILSPSIPTYFLWSGLLYIAATITIFILSTSINKHLCDVFVPRDKCSGCTLSDLIMCPKAACHQNAMNITIMNEATLASSPLTGNLKASSSDWHCLSLAKEAKDPVHMATKMYNAIEKTKTDGDSEKITPDCVKFHCAVLYNAISHQDLVSAPKSTTATGCPSVTGSKQSSDESNCVCSGLYQTMTVTQQVNIEAMCTTKFPSTTTTTMMTTTSTTETVTGAAARRMHEAPAEGHMTKDRWGNMQPMQEPDDERRLNHVPPTQAPADPAVNDGLPEYTVGEWLQCTCYQACNGGVNMQGIATRSVKCTGSKCKEPVPQISRTCHCLPCADCVVSLELTMVMVLCIIEGVLCLIMWLSISYMSSVVAVAEANLVSLTWGQMFLGCFVTQFPFLIRLGVLINTGMAIFFMIVTFIPKDIVSYQKDCANVSGLWVLSIFFSVLMAVMIIVGALMRKFKRMEPYIFRPVRPSSVAPIRIFSRFIRSLGP